MKGDKTAKVLVIGYGEIGRAIGFVENKAGNEVKIRDPALHKYARFHNKFDRVHVCIPYTDSFVNQVQGFIDKYEYPLMIVHSTVPVGTMSRLTAASNIVHSPVIGVHPDLVKGLIVFKKFLGGPEPACMEASRVFKGLWMDSIYLGPYEATELAKLLSTTYYGWNIRFAHEAKKLCDKYGQDFEKVYTKWNKEYNRGYKELGMDHVIRPVLQPPEGGVGEPCVHENALLLERSPLADAILELGKKKE